MLINGKLIEEAVIAASSATFKLVFLVLIGVGATAKGVFNERGISDLGRLVYNISLPALVFSNIITEVSVERLYALWKLPIMAVMHVSSAFLLAKLLSWMFRLKGIEEKAVKLCLMFGNCGALAIALIGTLCGDEPLSSEVGPICNIRGVEYISFYLITQNILMFTWAEEIVKDTTDEEEFGLEDDLTKPLAAQEPRPTMEQKTVVEEKPRRLIPPPIQAHVSPQLSVSSESEEQPLTEGRSLARYHTLPPPPTAESRASHNAEVRPRVSISTQAANGSEQPQGEERGMRRHMSSSSIGALDEQTLRLLYSRYPVDAMPLPVTSPRFPSLSQRLSFARSNTNLPTLALSPREGSVVRESSTPSQGDSGGGHGGHAGPAVVEEGSLLHHVEPLALESQASQARESVLEEPPVPPSRLVCLGWCYVLFARITGNPTIRAAMAAFVLGLIPPVKGLFVGTGETPLAPLLSAIQILGQAQVPISMLMLSGSGTLRYLNDKVTTEETPRFGFSKSAIFCIIAGRVGIFPFIGLLWWWAAFATGLLNNLPVLSLIVLIEAAVPTAQNVVMLLLVHGRTEQGHALAYVILWQYACAIPLIILHVTLQLSIVREAYPLHHPIHLP